jgi:hypothetical protein
MKEYLKNLHLAMTLTELNPEKRDSAEIIGNRARLVDFATSSRCCPTNKPRTAQLEKYTRPNMFKSRSGFMTLPFARPARSLGLKRKMINAGPTRSHTPESCKYMRARCWASRARR